MQCQCNASSAMPVHYAYIPLLYEKSELGCNGLENKMESIEWVARMECSFS